MPCLGLYSKFLVLYCIIQHTTANFCVSVRQTLKLPTVVQYNCNYKCTVSSNSLVTATLVNLQEGKKP